MKPDMFRMVYAYRNFVWEICHQLDMILTSDVSQEIDSSIVAVLIGKVGAPSASIEAGALAQL
jgi:hypothetical protein